MAAAAATQWTPFDVTAQADAQDTALMQAQYRQAIEAQNAQVNNMSGIGLGGLGGGLHNVVLSSHTSNQAQPIMIGSTVYTNQVGQGGFVPGSPTTVTTQAYPVFAQQSATRSIRNRFRDLMSVITDLASFGKHDHYDDLALEVVAMRWDSRISLIGFLSFLLANRVKRDDISGYLLQVTQLGLEFDDED